jgi:hypothetical protein
MDGDPNGARIETAQESDVVRFTGSARFRSAALQRYLE